MRRWMWGPALLAWLAVVLPAGVAVGQQTPGPTIVHRTSMEVTGAPSSFDVVNLVLEFAPGAQTPLHVHGGQGFMTVLEGELVHRPQGEAEQRVRAGETFLDLPGHPHVAANLTQALARGVFTVVLPKGAALMTVQGSSQPATLPETGADRTPAVAPVVALIAAVSLVAAGWRLRRARVVR